ncbi:MAG: hypothetical protein JNM58_09080 [Xanthomonadaceae bacterium]|nr:hypothetical protein [Xanthomonadaceae bacterium]
MDIVGLPVVWWMAWIGPADRGTFRPRLEQGIDAPASLQDQSGISPSEGCRIDPALDPFACKGIRVSGASGMQRAPARSVRAIDSLVRHFSVT